MTEQEASAKLRNLLPRYYAWLLELDRIEETGPSERTKPYPPASENEIAAAEKRFKIKYPGSYRAFLKMHNGWAHFSFDWWVCGVSGPGAERPWKEWTKESASFEKQCRKKASGYIDDLRSKSQSDAMTMYWPDHVPCAVDFNGGFRVFDRNRPGGKGEFEIAEVGGDEESVNRLPDFVAFVERCMKIARRELENHGVKPDRIEPVQASSLPSSKAMSPQSSKPQERSKAKPKPKAKQKR